MSIWANLLKRIRKPDLDKRAEQAEAVLKIVEGLVQGARNVKDAQERIAAGARRGDLDRVISWAQRRDDRVADFIGGSDG